MTNPMTHEQISRVLIVEDDEAQRITLSAILEREGCAVTGCATASEAIAHARRTPFGVAVVDLHLLDMEGTQLAEKLMKFVPSLRVIIHTGYGSFDSARDSVNLGAFAYVEKAADPGILLRHIHRAFREGMSRYAADLEAAIQERTALLRKSEARYRTLVERIPAVTYRAAIEQTRTTTYISPQIKHLVGYSSEEFAADPDIWRKALHPDDRERVLAKVSQLHATSEPFTAEYRMVARDGDIVWIQDKAMVVRDEATQQIYLEGFMADITKLKHAEEALRESEWKFRLIAETVRDVFWMSTPGATRMIYVSPGYERMFESSCDSLYRRPLSLLDRVHPDDRPELLRICEEYHARGKPYEHEYRIVRSDGEIRWISERGYPVFDERGVVTYMAGTCSDITARKQADATLRESEVKYHTLFELESDAVFLIDNETGSILEANRAVTDLYGYSRDELRSLKNIDLSNEPDKTTAATKGKLSRVPIRWHRRRDGTVFPVEIVASHFVWKERVVHIAAIRDITQRLEIEKKSRLLKIQLEHAQRLRTVQQMTAELGHELNQPLCAIDSAARGCLHLLRNGKELAPRLMQGLELISKEVQIAGQLIRRVRDYVRYREPLKKPLDLNLVIQEAVALADPEAREHGIRWQLELPKDIPYVMGDMIELQQVLMNLLHNAVEAMVDRPLPERILTIRTRRTEDERIEVIVVDRGHGFMGNNLDKVFDPYFTTKANGMGIGLPICRTIVEESGGRLWAEANPDGGAVFRFILPIIRGDQS